MKTSTQLAIYPILTVLLLFIRLFTILPSLTREPKRPKRTRSTAKLAVFLGSGNEALNLLSAVDFDRYTPRVYVVSEGDTLSVQKARDLEFTRGQRQKNQFTILVVPRARRVHQSLYTTPFTAFLSLLKCLYHVTLLPVLTSNPFADVLIVNGPGTCFILCLAVVVNKLLALEAPRVIYVESFARVKSFSISGKLLRYLADRFVVQWPSLLKDGKRGECLGWLV
ncbi:hypothetical protein E1B28_001567 [Marasmius oreades]|uniref:UDP-N-acetylglucosamine transferase subunit ALG14 n=1 Tax=Marasmius oreades TaxID=181124 RepID=A0A9P7V3V0_9AGAR|nr:uncharacterized protein E1B28_001567 [Marasmius oreades]KAG7099754.1 hypothetical protein E1B28_001567 [Marasmius oreades]